MSPCPKSNSRTLSPSHSFTSLALYRYFYIIITTFTDFNNNNNNNNIYKYVRNDSNNHNNINTIRNNINGRVDTACDGGISHNGVDTITDTDRDLVNSGVVFVLHLLFYNLQRLDLYENGYTYGIIYDIRVFNNNNTPCSGHLYNNNGTNNDTPDSISGVENDPSGTIRYGNNNISFINIYGVIVVNLA